MPTSSFKLFDENKANMLTDSEYSSNAQRLNGVQSGVASSKLQNKFQYQASLVAYAIAQLMVQNGYDATDSTAVTTFVNNMSNTMLQKVIDKATDAQAKEGTNNTKWMTPALVKSEITELAPMVSAILSNETKAMYGLGNTATPDDVFKKINKDISGNIGDIKLSATEINDPAWHKCDGSLFKFTGNEALVALNASNRVMSNYFTQLAMITTTSSFKILTVCCYDNGYAIIYNVEAEYKFVTTEDFKSIKNSYDISNSGILLSRGVNLFWRNNKFIIFAYVDGSNRGIFTSDNGETWSLSVKYSSSSLRFPYMDMARDCNFLYHDGVYYCSCPSDSVKEVNFYYSTDLVNWVRYNNDPNPSYVFKVGGMAIGNNSLMVVGTSYKDIYLYKMDISTKTWGRKILFSASTQNINCPVVCFAKGKFYCFISVSTSGGYSNKIIEFTDFNDILKTDVPELLNISEGEWSYFGTIDQLDCLNKGECLYIIYNDEYYIYNISCRTIEKKNMPIIRNNSNGQRFFSSNKSGFISVGLVFSRDDVNLKNMYSIQASYLTNNQYPFIEHGYIKIK